MNDTAPAPASGRYSLADDGQIFFQADSTNPLAGSPVGKIVKGAGLLEPTTDYDAAKDWLTIHVRSTLEPLFLLKQMEGAGALPEGPARDIGAKLYEHLGVMQRSDLEEPIGKLDADMRKALRAKGVRLGPILVFLPALVKPAAVKMRALLWGVWNDKSLPVVRPSDGRVSEVVDGPSVDRSFYRMIGYPVFGPRAIRIDMLDRVITDVYDTAQSGVFEAKHKYAEWLGTNLEDLHAVLESMGHRKLREQQNVAPRPDETPVPSAPDEKPAERPAEQPTQPAENPVPVPQPEQTPTGPAETPAPSQAPEVPLDGAVAGLVATAKGQAPVVKFMLKRGKMSDVVRTRGPQSKRPPRAEKPKKAFDPNKPQLLTEEDKERIKAREAARKEARDANKDDRPRKPKFDRKKGADRDDNREGRVYTFEGKKSGDDDDGNPFAILKNLKK